MALREAASELRLFYSCLLMCLAISHLQLLSMSVLWQKDASPPFLHLPGGFLPSPPCYALLLWLLQVDRELEAVLVCTHYSRPALDPPWLGCRGSYRFCFCLSCCRFGISSPGSSSTRWATRQTQTLFPAPSWGSYVG